MSSTRHERVSAVFVEAQRLDEERRGAFLDEACGGDAELRREVESLLEAGRRTGSALDTGNLHRALGKASAESGGVSAPRKVGPYRIVGVIGSGGMGTVYEAEQDEPRRRVALKVVRPGMVNPRLLSRFRHEANVLGQLRHPGIAQIYEAATSDDGDGSYPYFAMELVTGRSLCEYADAVDLGTRDRLSLIAAVCDALHHAHQKGVIHRDLKPANILLDEASEPPTGQMLPQPKILDFGIARATDADIQTVTVQTSVGELVGTLPYMSPEQAAGDPAAIDIRSDIYAVGVITFELLAGRLPYPVRDKLVHEAVRVIREEEPSRLSSTDRTLRGDVETIVAKALEKDKERRYQSAAQLAADIRRHLRDEPIVARPASAMYQLGKFARRNKALVAAAVVVFVGLAGAAAVATGFAVSESRQRDLAEREVVVGQAIIGFLSEMLSAPNPWGSEAGEAGDREVRVVDVLDNAAAGLDTAFAGQPEVEAALRTTLGTTYRRLGALDASRTHLERALALHMAEAGERHARTIKTMSELGMLYGVEGRHDEAEAMLSRVLDIHREDLGSDHPLTLAAMTNLALLYDDQGRYDEANAMSEEALAIAQRVLGEDHPDTISARAAVAQEYAQLGRLEESLELQERVLADRRRVLGPDHPDTIGSMNNTADTLVDLGRLEDAQALFEEAVAAVTRIVGEDHPQTLSTMNNLVRVYLHRELYEKGESLAVKTLEAQRRVLGDDHRETLIAISRLARLYADQDRLDEAEPLFLEALDSSRLALGEEHPHTMAYLNNVANFYRENGRYEDAEPLFLEALAIARATLGDQHWKTLVVTYNIGLFYMSQQRHDDAAPLFEQAVTGARQTLSGGNWRLGSFLTNYGDCLSRQGHHEQAEATLLEAYEILVAALDGDHVRVRQAIKVLADAYERWNRPDAAAEWHAKLPAEQEELATDNP